MAFKYTEEENNSLKVIDPIYGELIIPYPFSKIILTKEMQRLGRITQNGFLQYKYKDLANNDRLSHSVGAFYVMTVIIERLENLLGKYGIKISEEDKNIALCSILLHDIGHGPYSHSLEKVFDYSHERRTRDIILGDTEVGNLLRSLYGDSITIKIASFISDLESDEIEKNDFTKLIKNLVSYQIDADRLDYLVRDSYYIGVKSSIDLKRIIDSLNITINENNEYQLVIEEEGLAGIENFLIQRFQMYRDYYQSPFSELGSLIFNSIIERCRENKDLLSLPLDESFLCIVNNCNVDNLDTFLKMDESGCKDAFSVIRESDIDKVATYLTNFNNIKEYQLLKKGISMEKLIEALKRVFGDIDFAKSKALLTTKAKNKLYKKHQKLYVTKDGELVDFIEISGLVQPDKLLDETYVFFNPTLFLLELGLDKETYMPIIEELLRKIQKDTKKFELKYIVKSKEDHETLLNTIIAAFKRNDFRVLEVSEANSDDEYYDTRDLFYYKAGGSLRIRNKSNGEIKGIYIMPLVSEDVYSSRLGIQGLMENPDFCSFGETMQSEGSGIDFNNIVKTPILNVENSRINIILEKSGVKIRLSLDVIKYINSILNGATAFDTIIEIEVIGNVNDRVILNEIHSFISYYFKDLEINLQSKYERGIESTVDKYFETAKADLNAGKNASLIIDRIKEKK